MQGKSGYLLRVYQLLLPVVVTLIVCTVAPAQPRTMYKPHDIENARYNFENYAWAQYVVKGWKSDVRILMEQDRQFVEEFISDLSPGTWFGHNCPVCVEAGRPYQTWIWRWSPARPDRVQCMRCDTNYPHDDYPETGVLECPRMGQSFTYYQPPEERALGPDATPEQRREHALRGLVDRPQMTSWSGLIRMHKNNWAQSRALTLGRLYAVTGDVAYAERAAWIVDRFAQVFPNYLWHSYYGAYLDWPPEQVAAIMADDNRFPPEASRHAYGLYQYEDYSNLGITFWGSGRMCAHGRTDAQWLLHMTIAYDLVRDARHPDGTPVVDEQMQRRIEQDLLEAGCSDWEHVDEPRSNILVISFPLSAAVGQLLEQPERVRRALDGLNRSLEGAYHFDGFYSQSPHYMSAHYSSMAGLPDLLYGYSDPPDYEPEEGPRLENLNPFAHGRMRLALEAMLRLRAPGDRRPVIGSTRYNETVGTRFIEILACRLGGQYVGLLEDLAGQPLSDSGGDYSLFYRPADIEVEEAPVGAFLHSEWFPGWHVGVLRGGRPDDTALYMVGNERFWTVGRGHRHPDVLSVSYYAFGEELAFDYGYFSGAWGLTPEGLSGERWTSSTLSHNLVVVDESNVTHRGFGSNIELFGLGPGVEVIQASGFNFYPQCDEYRRTCALITTPDGQTYVADFFRVQGGRTHQYSFRCQGSLVTINPAQPEPQPTELSDAWMVTPRELDRKWLENPRAVTPEQSYTFTWTHNEVNFDLMMLNTDDTVDQIIVADAPGWRLHAGSHSERPAVQQIMAEVRYPATGPPAATQYAALMVPYRDEASPVLSARLLENDYETGAMAVEVEFADRTDYIISTKDQQPRQFGPVTVSGEFAFVSVDAAGETIQAYLLNGTSLQCGDVHLSLPEPNTTLRVGSVEDRTYHLAEPLSDELAETAWYVLAAGPEPEFSPYSPRPRTGFEIEATTANSITVRDYPVIDCDEITILHFKWLQR